MKNADSYFCIGSTHDVCQDYASSSPGYLMAIVSDGCSSETDTDFGSRLLVRAKEQFKFFRPSKLIHEARDWASAMNLSEGALTATLLTVGIDVYEPYFRTEICGDGVVVGKKHNGDIDVLSYEYLKGAPMYPRYLLHQENFSRWQTEFPENPLVVTESIITSAGEILRGVSEHRWEREDFETWRQSDEIGYGNWAMAEYEYVAVLSDGVRSFMKRDVNTGVSVPVDYLEVIRDLFQFKNFNGEFVKRRCKRALKDFAAKGMFHVDDFSMGVVVVKE